MQCNAYSHVDHPPARAVHQQHVTRACAGAVGNFRKKGVRLEASEDDHMGERGHLCQLQKMINQ